MFCGKIHHFAIWSKELFGSCPKEKKVKGFFYKKMNVKFNNKF
jgi:hypothetical protein